MIKFVSLLLGSNNLNITLSFSKLVSNMSSTPESNFKILWIRIPMKILKEDERWIYESQVEMSNPEQIVRSFVMRHPEIFVHPHIIESTQTHETKIIGVELMLQKPNEPLQTIPDLILRRNETYYVVEVKYKMASEPEVLKRVMDYYNALKYTLEKYGAPFDKIIPTVVFADENIDKIINRYWKSYRVTLQEEETIKDISYYPTLYT